MFRTIFQVEGPNNFSDIFIRKKLPNPITGNNDEFVVGWHFKSDYFRISRHSERMSKLIAQRPTHGQSRSILFFHPNAIRPYILSIMCFDWFDSSSELIDPFSFNGHAGFMVDWKWSDLHFISCFDVWIQNTSWITSIGTEYLVPIEQQDDTSCSAQFWIKLLFTHFYICLVKSLMEKVWDFVVKFSDIIIDVIGVVFN